MLTPYAAYIPAERLHLSGILAAVACGVYLGWRSGGIFRPEVRLQSIAFWDALNFILTALLFVLLGTQFRPVVNGLGHPSIVDPLVIFGVLTVVRLVWMLGFVRDTLRDRFVIGWSGMRGALSLAAALSIPVAVAQRNEILYLTFTTILAGLAVLAVPLPWLLDRLGFGGDDDSAYRDARVAVIRAALRRLDDLGVSEEHGIRRLYESRLERAHEPSVEHLDLRREVIAAERAELSRLERDGEVGHAAALEIQRMLDLEEARLTRR